MRNTILCILLVTAFGSPAFGSAEPAQALLNELTRPHSTPGLPPAGGAGLEEAVPEEKAEELGIPEFFTLDELKGASDEISELALAEESAASDLPLALNSQVEYFIHQFQYPWRQSFNGWLIRATRYLPMMKEIMRKEGLPEDLVYVAMIESGFTLHARSVANAVGPWQFMSATGRRYALRIDQWVDERRDPVKATVAAAMYLKELYGIFNNDWYLATAGYNAGENKILRAIGKYNTSDFWEISRGSYLKRETKDYVPKLLAAAIIAKDPAKYGFTAVTTLPTVEYDTVVVPGRTDLELVARLTGTTYQSIKELNPSLRHWCTPPNYPNFELKIPKGTKAQFEAEYAKIPEAERFTEKPLYSKYAASRKDSLASVARRFGTTPAILAELNGLSKKDKVSGRTLIVPVRQSVDFAKEGRGKGVNKGAIRYYTVRKGDTLQSLSKKFKVSAAALAAWNNIRNKTALKPGKRLIVAKAGGQSKAQS